MTTPLIPVTKPLLPPLAEFVPYLERIWASQQLTNAGPFHAQLESELADYLGVEHLSLFANGTLALMTALQQTGAKGEVITTPYTFVATAHSLLWNGIKPVFVDIDPVTLNIDPARIEAAITPQTTAIMPVHCYGNPCDAAAIQAVADRHGLKVIYDAAHAFGVRDGGGASVLRHGDLSCLSFHATKVFNTFEGGAIVSPDAQTKRQIDQLKNFGIVDEVTVVAPGINGKMSEINAAFGLLQLQHVDSSLAVRARIDARYRAGLVSVAGVRCIDWRAEKPNHAYFPILVGPEYPLSRDELYDSLKARGIHARRYFYPLVSSFSMYSHLPSASADNLPVARRIADQVLCLPIYPTLPDASVDDIVSWITIAGAGHPTRSGSSLAAVDACDTPTQSTSPTGPAAAALVPAGEAPEPICRITVAIPAYKARFLDAALRSAVQQQDCEDYEILVCDDCRTDAVAQVVQPYLAMRDGPRFRYIYNEEQLGEARNFAKCVELAHGRYVKLLCDDDVLLPGTLALQSAVLDAHTDIAIVTARRKLIDEHGNPLPDFVATLSPFDHDTCVHGHDLTAFLADHILNFIGEPSCTLFRRELLLPLGSELMALGGHPIAWLGDLAMHVNLMRRGHLAMLQQPGACFRITTEQGSQATRGKGDIGQKGRADFRRKIRELGWYRESGNELVRVAPLACPADFHYINLRTRVDRMWQGQPPAVPIEPWLSQRARSPSQLALIEQRLAMAAERPRIGVFIRETADTAALERTLSSLQAARQLCSEPQVSVFPIALTGGHWTHAVNAQAVALDGCDWLMMVDAGDEFTPAGLLCVAVELMAEPDCRAVYADGLARTESGQLGIFLRPDFNLDMLLSCPAGMARHWLLRRQAFLQAGGFDPAYADAAEFELLLRFINTGGLSGLGHISEPLLISPPPLLASNDHEIDALEKHLRARGYDSASVAAHLPGRYRIRYGHAEAPLVSIIIPTKDQFAMVERCVSSLLEKTAYQNYEILLVDNNSTQAAACAWLGGLEALNDARIRVLRYPHPFNYSAINNMAAGQARGDYLVLLNNDTAILQADWLDALLNHAQRPEVGIVGAKLLYPNSTIQHAGVVLGLRGPAEHPFNGVDASDPGYMQRLEIDQNYNAVTGACLMIRRSLYEEVAGLDETAFKVSYNDVDLCLKVRQAGYLIVWTPHALLLHEGSVSQKSVDTAVQQAKVLRFQEEQDALYLKWLPVIAHDTAYNQNLSLHGNGFEVETDASINRRPLPWRPQPVVLALAADAAGCGHYRVIEPVRGMQDSGIADARVAGRYFTPEELERLRPDTMVLQRQVTEEQLQLIQRTARLRPTFMVAELDDYLPNLPLKSSHRKEMPKDILRLLRRSVGMTDRFVVSTHALAEAFEGFHADTRVVENRLPPRWWRGLQSSRRTGGRPRVGWAGGASHQGDLELIVDVVKALKGEVDWVFFGMCPDAIKPYLHEFHGAVSIERYPSTLARMNLDLALAPLEQNLFNECKSNLRLLEYGACGYPVVCSDVRPYQGTLPVTRVKNRFKDWVDAIRAHVHDLDAAAAAGDRLKAAVEADWMLEGRHLQNWLGAWLPGEGQTGN